MPFEILIGLQDQGTKDLQPSKRETKLYGHTLIWNYQVAQSEGKRLLTISEGLYQVNANLSDELLIKLLDY